MNASPLPGTGFWSWTVPLYDLFTTLVMGRQYRRMKEWAPARLPPDSAVLELAAGTGALTKVLAPRAIRYVATDYSRAMVNALRRLPGLEVAVHDAMVPWPESETFDAVVAGNVLHLLPQPRRALEAARAALRPGGLLLAPTFCHGASALSRALSGLARRLGFPVRHRFSPESLAALLRESGFEECRIEMVPGAFPLALVEARRPPGTKSGPCP